MRRRYVAAYVRAQHEGSCSGMWWRVHVQQRAVCRGERARVSARKFLFLCERVSRCVRVSALYTCMCVRTRTHAHMRAGAGGRAPARARGLRQVLCLAV